MKTINILNGPENASAIIQGCMRMPSLSKEEAAKVIRTAYDCGINFFDHATCYGAGEAETRFSEAFPLTGLKREDIYIQRRRKKNIRHSRFREDYSRAGSRR